MALFSLGFCYLLLCIGNLDVLENGLKTESFLLTPSSRRHQKLIKGREFREAASTDPYWQKRNGAKVFFFSFFALGLQNQCARRTRNREINHCAPTEKECLGAKNIKLLYLTQEQKKANTTTQHGQNTYNVVDVCEKMVRTNTGLPRWTSVVHILQTALTKRANETLRTPSET